MNEINKDIRNQIRIAIKLGIHIPDFIKLDNFADKEKAQLNHHVFIRGQYAFEKTLGVKIGYCAYYNGTRFVNFTGMCLDSFMFSMFLLGFGVFTISVLGVFFSLSFACIF